MTEEDNYLEAAMANASKIIKAEEETLPQDNEQDKDMTIVSDSEPETVRDNVVENQPETEEYSYISETTPLAAIEHKTVLITGGARRIGRELVLFFAKAGWNVIIHCNKSLEEARLLAKEISKYEGHPAVLHADLSDETKVAQIFPQITGKYRKVDCLINNAAVFEKDDFKEISSQSWNKHMMINVKAPLMLMQDFAKQYFSDDGEAGNIINITDAKVFAPTASFFSYQISKQALSDITKTAALALAPLIKVNAVAPALVLPSLYMTAKQMEQKEQEMPLKRHTSTDEICKAVKYLIETPSVTGETLVLSGGSTI